MMNTRYFGVVTVIMLIMACMRQCIARPSPSLPHTKFPIRFGVLPRSAALFVRGGGILEAGTLREVEEIIEKASEEDMLVVIDFYSHNCPPCKMIAPLYEELSHEFPDVKFLKINVEENPEARQKFNVDGWPTFVFVKNGDVQDEIVGGNAAKLGLYDMVVKHRSHFEP